MVQVLNKSNTSFASIDSCLHGNFLIQDKSGSELSRSLFKRSVLVIIRECFLVLSRLNCLIKLLQDSAASSENYSSIDDRELLITSDPSINSLCTNEGKLYQGYSSTSFLAVVWQLDYFCVFVLYPDARHCRR